MYNPFRWLFKREPPEPTRRSYAGQARNERLARGRRDRRNVDGSASQSLALGPVEPMRIIEEARARANLTNYGLAQLSGTDQSYLRRLLNGQRRSPSRDVLIAIGEALMYYDPRFMKKDLERVLKSAGLMKLPRGWEPEGPRGTYNPRARNL